MTRASTLISLLLLSAVLSCTAEVSQDEIPEGTLGGHATVASLLTGQLLLPGNGGRRGLELHAWIETPDGQDHQLWILPEPDGSFSRKAKGVLKRVSIWAGGEVHRIETGDLPRPNSDGRVDLGTVDLREKLVVRRVVARAADGAPGGVVRMGLFIGETHTGPNGELPSLGSKQFPPVDLGQTVAWLMAPTTDSVHFLVERPRGAARGINWRSGKQQVFGPFGPSDFPLQLAIN